VITCTCDVKVHVSQFGQCDLDLLLVLKLHVAVSVIAALVQLVVKKRCYNESKPAHIQHLRIIRSTHTYETAYTAVPIDRPA
jgi:hypothetical protein